MRSSLVVRRLASKWPSNLSKRGFIHCAGRVPQVPNRILRSFSTAVNTESESSNIEIPEVVVEELYNESSKSTFLLSDHYTLPSEKSFYEVREGEYMEISKEDIKTYFPEGLAGDTNEEFDFSGKNIWMVRDSSKILCRVLDNFSQGKAMSLQKNVEPKVFLDGLTDRPEWRGTSTSFQYYSRELTPEQQPDSFLQVTQGNGSLVEEAVSNFQNYIAEAPKNILILGMQNRFILSDSSFFQKR